VSKQTVYAHFKSKQALFIVVVVPMTVGAAQILQEDLGAPLDDRPVQEFLLHAAIEQLGVVLTPSLMQLRRMVIGEVERLPEFGEALCENGPQNAISRLALACAHYTAIGQLHTPDPAEIASFFNWIVMGAPTSAAMMFGNAGIPDHEAHHRHAAESVRIFLCVYGVGAQGMP